MSETSSMAKSTRIMVGSRARARASTATRPGFARARTRALRRGQLALLLFLSGCSSLTTLTVRRSEPKALTLVPAPQLTERQYKRILLVPPEQGVKVSPLVESQIPSEKELSYYTSKLEKILLAKGFEVVSAEIVARAKTAIGGARTPAERAVAMGKETRADAVFTLLELQVLDGERFIHLRDLRDVPPAERAQDDDGRFFHRETEACLYRLPLYEVRIAAKLIDVQDGDVLWVGEGQEKTLDVLPKSWVAKLDEECQVEEQVPYNYRDYLASEDAFDATVSDLFMRLLEPLRKRALSARPAPVEVKPPPPPPPPPPLPPLSTEAKKPTALISGGRAILRDLPEDTALRISLVPRGVRVEVLQSSGQWHKIKLEDSTVGWMHDDSLMIEQ
jgi:hypothetical protein